MLPAVANTEDGRLDTARLLDVAQRAEAAGFDGVYVGDHLLHPRPILEAFVTLGAVAAVTKRVSLGTCVLLIALRDPLWLTKHIGTLAAFAPGRVRIGIGLGGEYPPEYDAVGVPLAERGRRAEDMLQTMRDVIAGAPPVVIESGVKAGIAPLPASPIPFLFAGRKEPALQRAARIGDGWIGYLLSVESFAKRRTMLLKWRAEYSKGPFVTGMLLPVHPDPVAEGAQARAAAAWAKVTDNGVAFPEKLFAAGSPDKIVEHLRRYWDAGCTEFVLSLADQGDGYMQQLKVLAEEILPRLHAFRSQQ
jgi:alkanesulfonate monooxygenase SsuD/methylene tetrahydromethanopterin reductase-like flavin-dependent oxidoreductase (luciferase family)